MGAQNRAAHIRQHRVRSPRITAGKILAEILEGLHWSFTLFVDRPFNHRRDLKTLHLLCYLLSSDVDLNEAGREDGHGVEGVPDNRGTDSSRLKFAVVHDH